MKYAVLVLSLLAAIFFNQFEMTTQNDSATAIISMDMDITNMTTNISATPITNIASTTLIPTVMMATVEVTSGDINPMTAVILTLTDMTDGITSDSLTLSPTVTSDSLPLNPTVTSDSLPLSPTGIITMTPQVMTTIVMPTESSIMLMVTTTSNPVPVPSDKESDGGSFSTGLIIGIAAGGGTGLLVILAIIICCVCCYCYQKTSYDDNYNMSTAIQSRPYGYASPPSRNPSMESHSHLPDGGKFIVFTNDYAYPKDQLIYQTPL